LTPAHVSEAEGDLFVHTRMPAWGVGLVVEDQPKRRSIQFQDGHTRTFRKGFYHLLEPWNGPTAARTEQVAANLREAHEVLSEQEVEESRREVTVSFGDQLRAFRAMYPGGFGGDAWVDGHRKPLGRRRAKRHVDDVLADAPQVLAKEALAPRIEASDFVGVVESLADLLSRTSLASPSHDVKPLRNLEAEGIEPTARGLFELLHGEGAYADRVGRWVVTLGRVGLKATWAMTSLPGALANPVRRGVVMRRSFTEQARILRTSNGIVTPSAPAWRVAQSTLTSVEERLRSEGEEPRDRVDVAMFIDQTLRPKTVKAIEGGEL